MGTEVITPAEDSSSNISELEQKIIRQVEYYFGNFNLCKDKFLREQIKLDDGWVPLETMVRFNRLKILTQDFNIICTALGKSPNGLVEFNEDSTKIRRRAEKPIPDESYLKNEAVGDRTLYVKGFRKNVTLDELLEFFNGHQVENIFMRRFAGNNRGFKGSCFVMFETVEDAEKFLENKSIKFEGTELLKEKKKDYTKRKDVYYDNLRAEKEKKLAKRAGGNKEDGEEDNDKEGPEVDIIPGCLLKLTGLGSTCSREELKKALGEFGNISYVDYVRGNPEAVVRFESGVAAKVLEKAEEEDGEKKFSIGSSKATVSVVEGDSEKEYWKSIARNKAHMRQKHPQNQHRQGKGRFKKQWGKRQKGNRREEDSSDQPPSKRFKGHSKEETESQASNGQEKEAKMDQKESDQPSTTAES
ncbi:Lupus La protein [Araneus ventricosus]|uniref:Lupus La protein n=1 Tax=Araneus ventricosus TaxID=182803 RepID=A0A4Y2DG56_ARAVE|nr:Lupus La protein [Araneus ventricosus]